MFFWKRVHTERVTKSVVLIVEVDTRAKQYTGSIIGRGWSAGSGNWFSTEAAALEDVRKEWAKRLEWIDNHEKSVKT